MSEPISDSTIDIAVFDLDGTLIKQDSLIIQVKRLAKLSLIRFCYAMCLFVVYKRVFFKKWMYKTLEKIDPDDLWLNNIIINKWVLNELRYLESKGCPIIVGTGAYRYTALKVLDYIGVKPKILVATENGTNLKGKNKLSALSPYIKSNRWAYYGDSKADIPLFKVADRSYLVKQSNEALEML